MELHRAAERLPIGDRSDERTTRMLIQALYEWLHERCESLENVNVSPNLACLLEHPVPLMKEERVTKVDLKEGSCIYLNDDPQRSPHIAGFTIGYTLPLSAKSRFRALFDGLRHLLGADRVRRVSQEPIDLDFLKNPDVSGGRLLDLIEQSMGMSHGDIEQELAALIAYGRSEQPMDPSKQAFRDHWSRFRDCLVTFGEFPTDGPANEALFDDRALEGPTLYVVAERIGCGNAKRRGVNLVRLSWRVVGSAHRDAFEAFAGGLLTDRHKEFLQERGIGDAEWDEIRTAIGAPIEQGRERLRAVAFALWWRTTPRGAVSEFESEWDGSGDPVAAVSRFFDMEESAARIRLNDARSVTSDEEEAVLAEELGVTVAEWQEARERLGLQRVQFRQTVRNFKNVARWVAGAIAVAASRYARLDADSVKSVVDTIRSIDCPAGLAETHANVQAVLVNALHLAAEVVENVPRPSMRRLAGALRREADRAPCTVQDIRLRGVPRRELNHFVDQDESERAKTAEESVRSLLRVAELLAERNGEAIDATALEHDDRVRRHTVGWWANAFAALRALKRAIARLAPRTARALGRERAFAALRSHRELWKAFPELGDPESGTLHPPSLPKRLILGLKKTTTEIEADLGMSGDGEIERKLRQYVQPDLDLRALAQRERAQLGPDPDIRRPGGTGGWRTTQRRDEDDLVGFLGELFVHQHFVAADFPDFDISCWVSENRGKYEGQTREPMIYGCDFRYRDIAGGLTGRNDAPLCFIEVKTTTSDGWAPFPITANEWRLAQKCHDERNEGDVYVVIRVRQVQDAPEIFDVIVNPVQAFQDGWLRPRNKDFYLVVGRPLE